MDLFKAVVLTGPTASGKSSFAHEFFPGFFESLIAADSRQIYRGFDIGTDKPDPEQIKNHRYRLVDQMEASENYSAYRFLEDVRGILAGGGRHLIIGGSAFYLSALKHGLPAHPSVPQAVRASIENRWHREGLDGLLRLLREKDPDYYEVVDKANPRRICRALEVIEGLGLKFSTLRESPLSPGIRLFTLINFLPREELGRRIEARVERMMTRGLVKEVRSLMEHHSSSAPLLASIGYREIVAHLQGRCTLEAATVEIKKNTKHLAKQQWKWFRKWQGGLYLEKSPFPENLEKSDKWFYNLPSIDSKTDLKEILSRLERGEKLRLSGPIDGFFFLRKLIQTFYEN